MARDGRSKPRRARRSTVIGLTPNACAASVLESASLGPTLFSCVSLFFITIPKLSRMPARNTPLPRAAYGVFKQRLSNRGKTDVFYNADGFRRGVNTLTRIRSAPRREDAPRPCGFRQVFRCSAPPCPPSLKSRQNPRSMIITANLTEAPTAGHLQGEEARGTCHALSQTGGQAPDKVPAAKKSPTFIRGRFLSCGDLGGE